MKPNIILATLLSLTLFACDKGNAQNPEAKAVAESAAETMAQPAPQQAAEPSSDEEVILTVNGRPLTRTMFGIYFQDRMSTLPNNAHMNNSQELHRSVLNEMTNVLIVAQEGEKKGYDQTADFKAAVELYKAKLLTQAVIKELSTSSSPSDEDIQAEYERKYGSQTTKEFKARHILVKEETEAQDLIKQLDEGADFAELAKTHSTGPTGSKGGDLGWFDSSRMVKPFSEAVAQMEKGSYVKTPVQTQFGWHVIMLEDTRESPPPSLDSVKASIVSGIQQDALITYMQDLREKSQVVLTEQATAKPKAAPEESAAADDATAENTAASENTQAKSE